MASETSETVSSGLAPNESQARRVWKRLRRNRASVVGLVLIVGLVVTAVVAPYITPYDYREQKVSNRFKLPSRDHWFGTDELGRDIFSRIVHGSRISLMTALVATGIAMSCGVMVGLVAGYYRAVDNVVMRLIDVLMAFPGILLAIAIVAALGPGLDHAIIAVGITSIPTFVRITRASVLSVRESEYVEAARAMGASDARVIASHVMPNIIAPIIVYGTLRLSTVILSAAILSFLGLGAQPPQPEWGAMVSVSRQYLAVAPHTVFFPILAIFVAVLAFNFVGDGLRDAMDPRTSDS